MTVWRHFLVVGCFVAACLGLAARVVYLNVTEREFLQGQGDARSVRHETLPAYRGVVFDRFGEPLAVSTPVVAVWLDPQQVDLSPEDGDALGSLLGLKAADIRESLARNRNRQFVYLKRHVSWADAEQIRGLSLAGVNFQPEYRRYYPASETAAHVVGMTDIDDVGIEGVELAFESHLRGSPGRKVVLRDRRGENVKDLKYLDAPRFGRDLSLSLDLRLQYLAYRELKAAVLSHRAVSGSLVMLDAQSGDILALVNQPSYNPNEIAAGTQGFRNRAVTDQYEPGSTIKPFTALAALESGAFHAASSIDTSPGYFRVGNKLVEDPGNRGTISLSEALQKSSQVGFAKLALALSERAVFDVLLRAGFGDSLGTGLPGETSGSLSELELHKPVVRATLAYGYGMASSPLQLAQAYLTLAAGGMHLPVSILHQRGPGVPARRVFELDEVARVLAMMESVTEPEGTAPLARVPGYRVAGKTGTTRVVGTSGYDDERHVALFAGIAPVSEPRLVMVVVINEPVGEHRSGGTVAAPIFARVAARALRLLGVRPDEEGAA